MCNAGLLFDSKLVVLLLPEPGVRRQVSMQRRGTVLLLQRWLSCADELWMLLQTVTVQQHLLQAKLLCNFLQASLAGIVFVVCF